MERYDSSEIDICVSFEVHDESVTTSLRSVKRAKDNVLLLESYPHVFHNKRDIQVITSWYIQLANLHTPSFANRAECGT